MRFPLRKGGEAGPGVVFGNVYDKYNSGSVIERYLVQKYFDGLGQLLADIEPARVLEVGAGEGHLATRIKPFISACRLYLATDLAAGSVEQGFKWAVMDAGHLGVKSGSFDLVLACEVLEHLQDPLKGLEEMARVCSGHLVATVPFEPVWRLGNVLRGRYLSSLGNTPGHLNHYTPFSLLRMVSKYFVGVRMKVLLPWIMVRGFVKDC